MNTFTRWPRRCWCRAPGRRCASGAVVVLVAGASGFIGIAVDNIPAGGTGELEVGRTANTRAGRLGKKKANGDATAVVLLNKA